MSIHKNKYIARCYKCYIYTIFAIRQIQIDTTTRYLKYRYFKTELSFYLKWYRILEFSHKKTLQTNYYHLLRSRRDFIMAGFPSLKVLNFQHYKHTILRCFVIFYFLKFNLRLRLTRNDMYTEIVVHSNWWKLLFFHSGMNLKTV